MAEAVCVMAAADPLEDEVRRMKAEVDALQVHVMAADRPWYLQISTLVSIFALVLSVWSTWSSHDLASRQNLREDRAELRELLQRLHAMPRENIELLVKYRDQPLVAGQLSSVLNSENAALSTQALGIVQRIGEEAAPSERLAVASALYNSGRIVEALEITRLAADSPAATANDVLSAYRSIGANFFMLGQLEEGRDWFGRARALFEDRFALEHPHFQLFSNVMTELLRAQLEAHARACPVAAEHADAAAGMIELKPELFAPTMHQQLAETRQMAELCERGLPITPPSMNVFQAGSEPTPTVIDPGFVGNG